MREKILIFDTTLRDGEQSPGATMNVDEKIKVAKQLERLNVDIIEAGFPISSEGDFESVMEIAREVKGPIIAGLARTDSEDIERAWEALQYASRPRLHVFIATSDIHLKHKLRKTRDEVIKDVSFAVNKAREFTEDVEFSAEDATRSDRGYLAEVVSTAIQAGATTINIPDTVGYTTPDEFGDLIRYLKGTVKDIDNVILSVHCHNDLGLAVVNSLEGIKNGVRQVECTINGIGERAGNTSLEELVMLIRTRGDIYDYDTAIDTTQIYSSSRLLSQITGIVVQPNKAIVGANAFAHEAGIHQDGVLKEAKTYEIMTPASIGLPSNILVMGKHSGRHAFQVRLKELGYDLSAEDLNAAFKRFKQLTDKKRDIYDRDLEAIVADQILRIPKKYDLCFINTSSGTLTIPTATVEMIVDGVKILDADFGDGPVDAAFKAISKITGTKAKLLRFMINAITGGTDALGEVTVRLEDEETEVVGQGSHTDIVVASAKAFVNALNKLEYYKSRGIKRREVGRGI